MCRPDFAMKHSVVMLVLFACTAWVQGCRSSDAPPLPSPPAAATPTADDGSSPWWDASLDEIRGTGTAVVVARDAATFLTWFDRHFAPLSTAFVDLRPFGADTETAHAWMTEVGIDVSGPVVISWSSMERYEEWMTIRAPVLSTVADPVARAESVFSAIGLDPVRVSGSPVGVVDDAGSASVLIADGHATLTITSETLTPLQPGLAPADDATVETIRAAMAAGARATDDIVGYGVVVELGQDGVHFDLQPSPSYREPGERFPVVVGVDLDDGLTMRTHVHVPEDAVARFGEGFSTAYVRRSMTTEATMNLRQLSDASARLAYSGPGGRGDVATARFPPSAPLTPRSDVLRAACDEGRQMPPWSAASATHPTWEALSFSVRDEHRYAYQYDSSGVGPGATFTASAFGDLDCDGTLSTFVRFGRVEYDGRVTPSDGMYIQNELE